MTVSAEGRVENQKLNRWVFGFQLDSLEKHLISLVVVTFSDLNSPPKKKQEYDTAEITCDLHSQKNISYRIHIIDRIELKDIFRGRN